MKKLILTLSLIVLAGFSNPMLAHCDDSKVVTNAELNQKIKEYKKEYKVYFELLELYKEILSDEKITKIEIEKFANKLYQVQLKRDAQKSYANRKAGKTKIECALVQ